MGIRSNIISAVVVAGTLGAAPGLVAQTAPQPAAGAKTSAENRAPAPREDGQNAKRGVKSKPGEASAAANAATPKAIPQATGAAGVAAAGAHSIVAGHPNAQAATPAATPAVADAWSEAEIKEAKAYCQKLLIGVDATYVEEDPIKQGACGSPVVYKLSGVGKGPGVEVSPPVTLTCDMIVALEKWMKRDVQPKARAMLGASIIKIETMSSYSCRNAYGRTRTKLSEHGRANAIDIAGFSTGKDSATILADWGPTLREQRAIAAKQEAERVAAAAAAASAAAAKQTAGSGTLPTGLPGTIAPMPGTGRIGPPTPGFGLAPNRLGGPKAAGKSDTSNSANAPAALPPAAAAKDAPVSGKRAFIHDIHTSACKIFGTVLGPEANNAHKNHFHLDMAPRRLANFCE